MSTVVIAESLDFFAPLRWLRLGWQDLMRNPMPGLVHGMACALFGAFIFWLSKDKFWLLTGAFSGFLIVAPILTTGLYQVSRNCTTGRCIGMQEVMDLWGSLDGRLVRFGLLLSWAGTGWVLTSAAFITWVSPVPITDPISFVKHVVLADSGMAFQGWLMLGGALAAPVFASSVVAIPMLVDTRASLHEAVLTSWRLVGANPIVLGFWAAVIMVLVGFAFASMLVGLIVVVPWLAHSSWHAYVELTHRA